MFLEKIFRFPKTLTARILFRITILLCLTYFVFFIILFFVLKEFLALKDRNLVKNDHTQVATLLNDDDMVNMNEFLNSKTQKEKFKNFLIKVTGPSGENIYYQRPDYLEHFDILKIDSDVNKKLNFSGDFSIQPKDIGHETIEVYADKINENTHLMVGINTDESEDFLWSFVNSLLLIILAMSTITILISYFYLRRSLMPIRDLIETIKAVKNGRIREISQISNGNDEIEELSKVFNNMVQHINSLLDSLQYSLDSIAHDLRTPLSHAITRGQMAFKSDDMEFHKETLYSMVEELKSLSNLLSTLLDISENQAGGINLLYTQFDLKKLLQDCIEIFEYASNDKKISIQLVDFESIAITADRNKLKQVFVNLISNSIKYSDKEVDIKINVEKTKKFVLIKINDNGWGLSDADKTRIWERLYRGDKARSTSGMGLGLTLVKSIIELHKGEIIVESKLGYGSTFTIQI